ncbi:hypothetical protein Ciccas_001961 [Cichlidogyrus casuarinus]|uniref:Headcase middle domain-containing protein n=1 Tax=Cichlidogyrus casuarinus TaxID=1844966 RepID=A0ABD2QJ40_9PLAT
MPNDRILVIQDASTDELTIQSNFTTVAYEKFMVSDKSQGEYNMIVFGFVDPFISSLCSFDLFQICAKNMKNGGKILIKFQGDNKPIVSNSIKAGFSKILQITDDCYELTLSEQCNIETKLPWSTSMDTLWQEAENEAQPINSDLLLSSEQKAARTQKPECQQIDTDTQPGKKRACKNCTCGLADAPSSDNVKSACGNGRPERTSVVLICDEVRILYAITPLRKDREPFDCLSWWHELRDMNFLSDQVSPHNSPLSINVPNNNCWADAANPSSLSPGSYSVDNKGLPFCNNGPLSEPGFSSSFAARDNSHACSIPAIVGCVEKHSPLAQNWLFSSGASTCSVIRCKQDCGFLGLVHNNCMNHWMNSVATVYKAGNVDMVRKYYECPGCEQPSLIKVDQNMAAAMVGSPNTMPDEGFYSDLCSPSPLVNGMSTMRRIAPQTCESSRSAHFERLVSGPTSKGRVSYHSTCSNSDEVTSSGTSGFVSANCPSLTSLSGFSSTTPDPNNGTQQPRTLRSISEHQGGAPQQLTNSNCRLSAGSIWRANNNSRKPGLWQNFGMGMWSPNDTPSNYMNKNGSKFGSQNLQINEKGNIFQQRKTVICFQNLPEEKQNTYFIQSEDDSCTGNEDLRTFLLTQLTNKRICELPCLACGQALVIFDHFPVLDGLLFLSPVSHLDSMTVQLSWNSQLGPGSSINSSNGSLQNGILVSALVPPPGCSGPRQQQSSSDGGHFQHRTNANRSIRQERYLHALCLGCAGQLTENCKSSQFRCKSCQKPWIGSSFLVGGLYTYDIFACQPCCNERLRCKYCGKIALSTAKAEQLRTNSAKSSQEISENANQLYPLPYFSQYSMKVACQHCKEAGFHFVRPFNQVYMKVTSS